MRTFLDAIKQRASVRILFYHGYGLEVDEKHIAETKAAMQSEWELDDLELVTCRQQLDPSHGDKLWQGYLVRALSMHRQLDYVRTSGAAQLRAFEDCLADRPDFVFAHRLNTMCPALLTRRELPPIFLDLDDVEHKAFIRGISQPPNFGAKRLFYLQLPAFLWGERRAIRLARKTFVCSELDAQYLSGTWRLPNVRAIPNSIRVPEPRPMATEPVFLLLGLYAYAPNAVAADYLITRIWPLIRSARPDARLIIAGGRPELIPCFGQPHAGVEYAGFVDDLDVLYSKARIVCCPILSGGGTRIKIIEAAAYGKAVVSTRVGAEGLDFEDGSEIMLRDDPQRRPR